MTADDRPIRVDDLARALARGDARFPLDDGGITVLLRHEADLVRLLLARDRQSALLRDVADLRLRQIAERKERVAQLILRQLEEEVRLVLRQIASLAQLELAIPRRQARVMAGGNFLRANRDRLLMKEIELHVRV